MGTGTDAVTSRPRAVALAWLPRAREHVRQQSDASLHRPSLPVKPQPPLITSSIWRRTTQLFAYLLTLVGGQLLPALLQFLTLLRRHIAESSEVVADATLLRTREILKLAIALP